MTWRGQQGCRKTYEFVVDIGGWFGSGGLSNAVGSESDENGRVTKSPVLLIYACKQKKRVRLLTFLWGGPKNQFCVNYLIHRTLVSTEDSLEIDVYPLVMIWNDLQWPSRARDSVWAMRVKAGSSEILFIYLFRVYMYRAASFTLMRPDHEKILWMLQWLCITSSYIFTGVSVKSYANTFLPVYMYVYFY